MIRGVLRLTASVSMTLGVFLVGSAAHAVASPPPAAHLAARPFGLGLIPPPSSEYVPPVSAAQAAAAFGTAPGLPSSVDLEAEMPPVGDQGSVNSCVSWAVGYTLMGYYMDTEGIPGGYLAPMYLYSQAMVGDDGGSNFTTFGSTPGVFNLADSQGADTESDYWQGYFNYTNKPTADETANAASYELSGFQTLFIDDDGGGSAGTTDIQEALADNEPVVIALPIYSSYYGGFTGYDIPTSGNPADTNLGTYIGFHSLVAVGYDSWGIIVQNQWGTGWGTGGLADLSYDYVDNYVTAAYTASGGITQVSSTGVAYSTPSSGSTAGGTSVSITGVNFTGTTAVDFGSTPSTDITVNSSTSITAVSPSESAGIVDITVTAPGGTSSDTDLATFLYTSAGAYYPVTPYRVCDTRSGNPSDLSGTDAQCDGSTLQAGSGSTTAGVLSFQVSGTNPSGSSSGGVPSTGVTAVVVNVTVIGPTASSGNITVWPTGSGLPGTGNVTWWSASSTVSNQAEVAVGTGGDISVHNSSTGTADVAITVEGYVGNPDGESGLFIAVPEFRLVDTRSGSGDCDAGKPLSSDASLTLQVSGTLSCESPGTTGVPATGVSAVLLKVAEVASTAGGTLAAYPAGSTGSVTLAGVTNFPKGEVLSNHAIVGVGNCVAAGCDITVYNNSSGTTNITVDVLGYFTDSAGTGGTSFTPVPAARICDTRGNNPSELTGTPAQCNGSSAGGSTLQSDTTQNFSCSTTGTSDCEKLSAVGMGGIPSSGAASVVLDVSVIDPSASGNLIVAEPESFVSGDPLPTATLAFAAGYTLSALVVVSPDASGNLEIWNQSSGTTNCVVSVVGWYQ